MNKRILIGMLISSAMLTACGQKTGQSAAPGQEAETTLLENAAQETALPENSAQETMIHISGTEDGAANGAAQNLGEAAEPSSSALPSKQELDSGNPAAAAMEPGAIPEQTFDVALSEYSGKVRFTPYAPMGKEEPFRMEITQNGKLLTRIPEYVPEWLEGETFNRLDAVAFEDVNFDGNTDILLIATYGDVSFAAVYYGFADKENPENERYFLPESQLSEALTRQVQDLTIPGIRKFLTGGKKNGEFSSYQEAYEAVGRLSQLESGNSRTYNLIYLNDDAIPELAEDVPGYNLSLYTYADGRVYQLMDHWGYGAMGNAGYEYSAGKNSLRNYDADYAGAIMSATYMTMDNHYSLDTVVQIVSYNFDDVNGNGMLDDEEMDSVGLYGVNYIDGAEVSPEECAAYDLGGYAFIEGTMSFDELKKSLNR